MSLPVSQSIVGGLVSVTFRKLTPEEIVQLVVQSGLGAIEWGGDVHVPHGDVQRAREVGQMTADAGLAVSAYGSYYRVGAAADQTPAWDAVTASAKALGATSVRVWAGTMASASASADDRANVVADLQRICRAAAADGLTVDLEYHANTLTDALDSTLRLLQAADQANLRSYWQTRNSVPADQCLADLTALAPHLGNLHVFHWWPTLADRLPLAAGVDRWKAYLAAVPKDGRQRFASLEFVAGDRPEQFLADAVTLRELLAEAARG